MKILRSRTFQWWEVFFIKICLLSLGILLGLYFHDQLSGLALLWWILFVISAVYFVIRFFKEK